MQFKPPWTKADLAAGADACCVLQPISNLLKADLAVGADACCVVQPGPTLLKADLAVGADTCCVCRLMELFPGPSCGC